MGKPKFGRKLWSSIYGLGEGFLDTASFGLTDNLTDKGYSLLSQTGKASQDEITKGGQFRDLGNIGGSIVGGITTGNVKGAINEGAEGLAGFVEDTNAKPWLKAAAHIGAYGTNFLNANKLNDPMKMSKFNTTNFASVLNSKHISFANDISKFLPTNIPNFGNIQTGQNQITPELPKVYSRQQLTNFKDGGPIKPKPIYVTDRNDYRLKDYNDSLNLYNITKSALTKLKNNGFKATSHRDWSINEFDIKQDLVKDFPDLYDNFKKINNDLITYNSKVLYFKPTKRYDPFLENYVADADLVNFKIPSANHRYFSPIGESDFFSPVSHMSDVSGEILKTREKKSVNGKTTFDSGWQIKHDTRTVNNYDLPLTLFTLQYYKSPVQPIKYADPEIVEKQKKLKEANLYDGELDGIWGPKSQKAWDTLNTPPATETETISTSTTKIKKPVSIPQVQTNPNDYWRFYLGNTGYVTTNPDTANSFAQELGIQLKRGDNRYTDESGNYKPFDESVIGKYKDLKRFKDGGQIMKKVPIEAEGNEYYDGFQYEGTLSGPSHQNGGIPMQAEEGAFIYPKGKHTKLKEERVAQQQAIIDKMTKLANKFKKSPNDKAGQNAFERSVKPLANELERLEMEDQMHRELITAKAESKKGKTNLPAYGNKGLVEPDPYNNSQTLFNDKDFFSPFNTNSFLTRQQGPYLNNYPSQQRGLIFNDNFSELIAPKYNKIPVKDKPLKIPGQIEYEGPTGADVGKQPAKTYKQGMTTGDILGAASYLPAFAYNLYHAFQKPQKVDPFLVGEINAEQISPEMQMRAIKTGINTTSAGFNQRMTPGMRAANLSNLNVTGLEQLQNAQFTTDQANAQLRQQTNQFNTGVKQFNAQQKMTAADLNAQNIARKQLFGATAATNAGNIMSTLGVGMNQRKYGNDILNMLGSASNYFNVEIGPDGKPSFKLKTKQDG